LSLSRSLRNALIAGLGLGLAVGSLRAAEPAPDARWPGWRGNGQGVAPEAKVPLEWSDSKNVLWKAPLPGRGHSSPIVWGDRIFVTTAIEGEHVPGSPRMKHPQPDGTDFRHPDAMGDDHRHTFKVLAVDGGDGKIVWERTAWEGVPVDSRHKKGSFASPTAATDGERVYAYFGTEGLYAYDFAGNLAWKFLPGVLGSASVGLGTSPVLYKDLVILVCDEENGEKSFVVALDRRTGKEVWRTPRKIELSWATPVIVNANGRDELITSGNQANIAYDPATGRELWRMEGLKNNAVTTPVVGDGVVVISSGYPDKLSLAVKPGGSGDVTSAILWRYAKGSAYVPSPILYGGYVYLLTDKGLVTCLDAKTGAVKYEGARPPVPATFMASPVAVDGRLLLMSQDGDTFVVKAGPEFAIERTNTLGEPISASAAVAGGRLYIRGEKHLFAIGTPAGS
jgi:outer membrane protein assembly factor BamB